MIRGLIFAALTIGAVGASHAWGAVAEHPYSGIVGRNAFGLRPIPPPQAEAKPEVAPPPPSREIKLTGITTLLGPAKVFIEIVDLQTKKTERPNGMTVGEEQFEVEIVSVNPEDGVVRIRNRGEESTLDFVNNGIKPGAAGSPAGNPTHVTPPPFNGFRPPAPPAMAPHAANPALAPGPAASRAIVAGGPSSSSPAATTATGIPPEAEARIEAYKRMLQARQQNGGVIPGITPPSPVR